MKFVVVTIFNSMLKITKNTLQLLGFKFRISAHYDKLNT
jgi:hypothetical protein